MTKDEAFFDRRAAIAAVLVCPLGAVLALFIEACGVSLYFVFTSADFEPVAMIGPVILAVAVILLIAVISVCVLVPLVIHFPFTRPLRFVELFVPVFGVSSALSAMAAVGLWWQIAHIWNVLVVTYGLFVIPPTSAAIMYHITYRWLARRHPDE